MSDDEVIDECAAELWQAEQAGTPIRSLRHRKRAPSRDDAYLIQAAVFDMRIAAGQRVVGRKVGLTSRAMQEMSGVTEPDYGTLFDTMRLESPARLARSTLIQPMVEPELGFVMAEGLGSAGVTRSDVLRACAFITPVLEVVDSRIEGWQIDWVDTVSDNASTGMFVVGPNGRSPLGLDLRTVGVVLEKNNETVATAAMAEVLGDPVGAVVWLANRLASHGASIEAGDIVLAGAPCRAVALEQGDVISAHMSGLPTVSIRAE